MLDSILLALGLCLLVKGADWLVQSAEGLASRFGVSPLVVGLTVVSLGTSLPEMIVTMFAGLRDAPGLAVENIVGSNIANILLVLGVAAMMRPLSVRDSTRTCEIPFSLLAAVLVGLVANMHVLSAESAIPMLSRADGMLLLLAFAIFVFFIVRLQKPPTSSAQAGTRRYSTAKLVLGASALCVGGTWAVHGAVGLAADLGVDDAIVGLTVVAVGTSTPELFASSLAALRGQADIAVGNVVGSNIFNLLLVLGATASVVELPFNALTNTDLILVIVATVLVIVLLSRRKQIGRMQGVFLVFIYFSYMIFTITRASG